MAVELVLFTVGGVQRFLAESRKTVDIAGASLVFRRLVIAAASEVQEALRTHTEPIGLIFPPAAALAANEGVTNKIAFLAPAGLGAELARRAQKVAEETWRDHVRDAYAGSRGDVPDTPGLPDISWVSVPGDEGEDHTALWERAQAAMTARRRSRVFTAQAWQRVRLCQQSAAVPAAPAPRTSARRERRELLSAAGWTKRAAGNQQYPPGRRFPATTVVASAAYRARLLHAAAADSTVADRLRSPVGVLSALVDDRHAHAAGTEAPPGLEPLTDRLGTAVYPDLWTVAEGRDLLPEDAEPEAVARGAAAARDIAAIAQQAGVAGLSSYYAVVVQDLDRLGLRMSGLGLAAQRSASATLTELGRAQRRLSETREYLGVPVYAGGDDFFAFVPAAHALELAGALRQEVDRQLAGTPLAGATASTAVVFAHFGAPLQQVVSTAQEALAAAKDAPGADGRDRDAVTVVAVRRGGERARTVLPWTVAGRSAVELLRAVAPDAAAGALSAALASSVERDAAELDALSQRGFRDVAEDEMRRRVARQGGGPAVAAASTALGAAERAEGPQHAFRPARAMLVARFLAQECR
ncbi:type III-B CRISPR-associated protein Cas10/Cmr2 [Amycolatopsis sp. CA-128772]|uniref:Cas10/Cmr2 second palm domain-containing protein n=1 Tax=Amycolatopsis sp. CA-128772 TaxID=2073159 RepID=UPI000CD27DEB|nr:type III-B CRISPR-associated protein Cas10/Cmr2 [Amycolatopsis sp. CA-128772]